jgi:hypothetical protein
MSLELPLRSLSFAGHETFSVRHLWPKKGFDALEYDPACFADDDAMVALGVGKNMVRSIRYWGLCFGLWEEDLDSRGRRLDLTALGRSLLADDGWDPFLEDAGTIWWLHWRLVQNPDRCTAAKWLFSRPRGGRFNRDEVVAELESLIAERHARRIPRASLRRDLDVVVRCYARTRAGLQSSDEEGLDSPLCDLDLIRHGIERGTFEMPVGVAARLPDEMLAAALYEYATSVRSGARTLPLHDVLYAPLSPGRVFRLTEDALARRLARLESKGLIAFDETAGLRQVLLPRGQRDPMSLLAEYFSSTGGAS